MTWNRRHCYDPYQHDPAWEHKRVRTKHRPVKRSLINWKDFWLGLFYVSALIALLGAGGSLTFPH